MAEIAMAEMVMAHNESVRSYEIFLSNENSLSNCELLDVFRERGEPQLLVLLSYHLVIT